MQRLFLNSLSRSKYECNCNEINKKKKYAPRLRCNSIKLKQTEMSFKKKKQDLRGTFLLFHRLRSGGEL